MHPHSHVKRLNAEGWIKLRQKHNVKVKVECAMWNEWTNGLTTNHSHVPLSEQEWMWALDAEEMESSSKINLRDVSWWMSIINAYKPRALVTTRLSKEGCISLVVRGTWFRTTRKHDWRKCGPPSTWETYSSKTSLLKIQNLKHK
jgi:hypothetical protein